MFVCLFATPSAPNFGRKKKEMEAAAKKAKAKKPDVEAEDEEDSQGDAMKMPQLSSSEEEG